MTILYPQGNPATTLGLNVVELVERFLHPPPTRNEWNTIDDVGATLLTFCIA